MAFEPCHVCGSRYKGASSSFYPALVKEGNSNRRKLKVCPPCGANLRDWADLHLSLVSEGDIFYDQRAQDECALDGSPLDDGSRAFFLSEYLAKHEPRQYYGQLCGACAGVAEHIWALPSAPEAT